MTDTPAEPSPSARQYLQDLHYGQGRSWREIAAQLGRSERLVRMIATGARRGDNLTEALRELTTRGQISQPPPRRTNAAGDPVPVRARGGGTRVPQQPTAAQPARRPRQDPARSGEARRPRSAQPRLTPQEYIHQLRQRGMSVAEIATQVGVSTGQIYAVGNGRRRGTAIAARLMEITRRTRRRRSQSTEQPRFTDRTVQGRNTLEVQSEIHPTSGREFHRIRGPRGRRAWNRLEAMQAINERLSTAARNRRRFHGTVWVALAGGDLRPVRLGGHGGYDAEAAWSTISRAEGGDSLGWLTSQVAGRYPELDDSGNWDVVAFDVDIW